MRRCRACWTRWARAPRRRRCAGGRVLGRAGRRRPSAGLGPPGRSPAPAVVRATCNSSVFVPTLLSQHLPEAGAAGSAFACRLSAFARPAGGPAAGGRRGQPGAVLPGRRGGQHHRRGAGAQVTGRPLQLRGTGGKRTGLLPEGAGVQLPGGGCALQQRPSCWASTQGRGGCVHGVCVVCCMWCWGAGRAVVAPPVMPAPRSIRAGVRLPGGDRWDSGVSRGQVVCSSIW
jgi:hypothetical protein